MDKLVLLMILTICAISLISHVSGDELHDIASNGNTDNDDDIVERKVRCAQGTPDAGGCGGK